MTNLTDEGLRGLIKSCRWDIGNEPPIGHPKNDDFMEADMSKILALLQQVRDAAKKEERENCERIIRKRMVCEFDPRLSPMPDEKMGLCRELITAIRQME